MMANRGSQLRSYGAGSAVVAHPRYEVMMVN